MAGNIPTRTDLENMKQDIDDLADIVNSVEAQNVVTRLGKTHRSLTGRLDDLQTQLDAKDATASTALGNMQTSVAAKEANAEADLVTYKGKLARYAAVNYKGDFVASTAYEANDVWKNPADNTLWIVPADYTSGATAQADIDAKSVRPHQDRDRVGVFSSVHDIEGAAGLYQGEVRALQSWHAGWAAELREPTGGGLLCWHESLPRTYHNGGIYFSPTASYDSLSNYLNSPTDPDSALDGVWARIGSAIVDPFMWGAKASGNDDTLSIQACWNYQSQCIDMSGSLEWCATNLVIPNRRNFELTGRTTIKAISGGDTYYLCASYKHINNITQAQYPIRISDGICFDGDSLVDHPLILQSWNSDIDIEAKNGLSHGFVLSAETRAGNTFPESSMVNNRLKIRCHHNAGKGFYAKDAARNNATDGYILPGSYVYANGDDGCMIDAGAGWDVQINTYANDGAGGWGVRFNSAGKGTRVHDSYIDEDNAVTVSAHIGVGLLKINDSQITGRVTSVGTGDAAPYGILSKNNIYSGDGHLYHQFFGSDRHIISSGDSFETADPFRFHNGSSTGKFKVFDAYLGAEDRFFTGVFNALKKTKALVYGTVNSEEYNNAKCFESDRIMSGSAFSIDVPFPKLRNYEQRTGLLTINTRKFDNSDVRVTYTAMVNVQSKDIAGNSLVASISEIVKTPAEWTVEPSISITDNGDGTGTITVAGEPSDTDGNGPLKVVWF